MEALLHALYFYAQENQVFRRLQTPEYRRAVSETEESWEAFRSTLTAEQKERLDALLSQNEEIAHLVDEASFCCALSMGIALGRL